MRLFSTLTALLLASTCSGSDIVRVKAGESSVPKELARVLQAQADGGELNRREKLGDLSAMPDSTRWHAGELRVDRDWLAIEELDADRQPKKSKLYNELRRQAPGSTAEHRQLARICDARGLKAHSRAHWTAVLATLPDDIEAHTKLGHQLVRGVWFSPQELEAADRESKRLIEEWRKWMPQINKIVKDLNSPNVKLQQRGIGRLAKIDAAEAISSLELAARLVPDQAANLLISAICEHRTAESCLALVRIALAYPTDQRGERACKAVAEYPMEFYVPALVALLNSPIETRLYSSYNNRGELCIRRAMFRETASEKQRLLLERLVRTSQAPTDAGLLVSSSVSFGYARVSPATSTHSRAPRDTLALPEHSDEAASGKLALDDQSRLESAIDTHNEQAAMRNEVVSSLLKRCTGEQTAETASDWWKWWDDYNYRYSPRKSLRDYRYSHVDQAKSNDATTYVSYERLSCLSAGTQVATARGMQPIEEIQIGDLVPSQDVETGELTLKPVLQTTVRPPAKLFKVTTEAGELKTTLGHRWFVSGKGWLMAVDLRPGMLLHDATGTTRIEHIEELSQKEKAYNLVVADFHTYFVGPSRVLSYDNAPPPISTRPVPGFGDLLAEPGEQ